MNKSIRDLIEMNRQQGTTTILAEAALANNGTLVVGTLEQKDIVRKEFGPNLQCITMASIVFGRQGLGLKKGPLFFDTTAIMGIPSDKDGYYSHELEQKQIAESDPDFKIFINHDGYSKEHSEHINVKLTKDDMIQIKEINTNFFEKEAPNSMLGRILIRKGIQFFKNLK